MALSDHGQYSGVVDIARNGIDEVIRLKAQGSSQAGRGADPATGRGTGDCGRRHAISSGEASSKSRQEASVDRDEG